MAAGVLSTTTFNIFVAIGVQTERRLLTFATLVLGAIQLYKIKCDGHSEPPQKPQLSRGELIEGILLWVHDREAAHGWVRALHTAVDG